MKCDAENRRFSTIQLVMVSTRQDVCLMHESYRVHVLTLQENTSQV